MSFILDALKKLEQKRQHGAVPDLMTIHAHERETRQKRVIWPYLVLGILVLNAGILATMFRPWEADNKKTTVPIPVQPYVRKNEPASASSQGKMGAAVSDKKPVVPKASPMAGTHSDDTNKISSGPKHQNAAAPVRAKIKAPLPVEESSVTNKQYSDEDTPSALSLNPSPQDMDVLRKKINEETSHSASVPPRKEPALKKPKTVSEEQIPDFSQLPEDTKKELPNIIISAHIYSNNPRSRIININGSTVKEGDEIIKGMTVVEITMSGVILDYQGHRFQVRAF